MSGELFDLEKNAEIQKLRSPKSRISGPIAVVYKAMEERWVIVAFLWDGKPVLAMRWFWGKSGNPFSSSHPTWFVLPRELSLQTIRVLKNDANEKVVEKFLEGKLSIETISYYFSNL